MPTAPILTLGARWKADDVYWWRSPANATLLGVNQANVTGVVANFAQQSGIYVLYANFVPLYVGQANKTLWARLRAHMFHDDLAGRWDRFTWLGFRKVIGGGQPSLSIPDADFHVTPKRLRDHLEAALIHCFEPPMNGQEGRFGKTVIRYKQVRDELLGPDDRDLLESIADRGRFLPEGKKITKSGWKDIS